MHRDERHANETRFRREEDSWLVHEILRDQTAGQFTVDVAQ